MTEKRRGMNEEIEQALQVLDSFSSGENDENDRKVDAAFRTLIEVLPEKLPRGDFSNRVMSALRNSPLPAGRRKLRARRPKAGAGLVGVAAAAGFCVALWTTGFVQPFVARGVLAIVQNIVLATRLVSFMPQTWRWVGLAVRALAAIIGSTEMLSVLVIMTLLSVLTFAALARVVASSRVGGA
jgi:hypothetical protein